MPFTSFFFFWYLLSFCCLLFMFLGEPRGKEGGSRYLVYVSLEKEIEMSSVGIKDRQKVNYFY